MSIKCMTQLFASCFVFLLSSVATWYNGSSVLEGPLSASLTGGLTKSSAVHHYSHIDYLLYTIKFHPQFPIMMMVSGIYLIVLLSIIGFKKRYGLISSCCLCITALLCYSSYKLSHTPTEGEHAMITSSLAAASLCLAVGLFYLLKRFYSQKEYI